MLCSQYAYNWCKYLMTFQCGRHPATPQSRGSGAGSASCQYGPAVLTYLLRHAPIGLNISHEHQLLLVLVDGLEFGEILSPDTVESDTRETGKNFSNLLLEVG